MAPKVELFWMWKTVMKLLCFELPFPQFPHFLASIWRSIVLYGCIHYECITVWAVVYSPISFTDKLETALFVAGGLPFVYWLFIYAMKKNELYALVERMDSLLEEIENEYGPRTLVKGQKITKLIALYYVSQFWVIFIPAYTFTYYQYYFLGDECAMPFIVYTPFNRKQHFHLAQAHCLVTYMACAAGLVTGNTFLGSLTIFSTTVIDKIKDQLSQISPASPANATRKIIRWHSELINVVEEANSVLGTGYVVDYMASIVHICISGYILLKSSAESASRLGKNLLLCVACVMLPVFYCVCGHIIKSENEELRDSIFRIDWLALNPKGRKDLLLPAILANKGLGLQYKRLVKYDVISYLKILKQSYSFLTVLKLMDQRSS